MTAQSVPIYAPNVVPTLTGFVPAIASDTTITLTAGICTDASARNYIVSNSVITIDSAVAGLNGLDTGTIAADSFYAILAVGDSTNQNDGITGGMLTLVSDTSTISPVLPSKINPDYPEPQGYDMYRVVGYVLTDGSAHFLPGVFSGQGTERAFAYATGINVLTSGSSGTFTPVDLINGSNHIIVPAGAEVALNYFFLPDSNGDTFALLTTGVTSTNGMQVFSASGGSEADAMAYIIAGSDTGIPAVSYKVEAAGDDALTLLVAGYKISL